MILQLYNGVQYDVHKSSAPNCFVTVHDSAPTTFPMLPALTDVNLTEYRLIGDDKTIICKNGHLLTTKTYLQTDGRWRTDYYIKTLEDTTDYKKMAEGLSEQLAETQAELTESNRALSILFGEEE